MERASIEVNQGGTAKAEPFVLEDGGLFASLDRQGLGEPVQMKITISPEGNDTLVDVRTVLTRAGFACHVFEDAPGTVVVATGEGNSSIYEGLRVLPGVESVFPILQPFKLSGRETKATSSTVDVRGVKIGEGSFVVMAGPCAVESAEQLIRVAEAVKELGASVLRGGAFKPRTSPYSFQGLKEAGLQMLAEASERTGLPVITEVMDTADVDLVSQYSDMLQIGARNMSNFALLSAVGRSGKPVLLKRGFSATIDEWLMAAEYVMVEGNHDVVLCERGIRTHETYTRNTLDLAAVAAAKQMSHLPVIADPSHGTGRWRLVAPLSLAAIAAGADGLMLEVHDQPDKALSDGAQSLKPVEFGRLMKQIRLAVDMRTQLRRQEGDDQS